MISGLGRARLRRRKRLAGSLVAKVDALMLEPAQARFKPFDIVLAADVLVYIGDLARVFAAVRARLRVGGLWLFTCERCDGDGFQRGMSDRFRHSADYVKRCGAANAFVIENLIECVSRYESGVPVQSLAGVLCAKRAGDPD